MNQRLCIVFAGAMGSSKSPVAYYVSQHLGWPIFNNDAIRTEVKEDVGELDKPEYERREKQRFNEQLARQISFIFDASIDRSWDEARQKLEGAGFEWFIISFDLPKDFLRQVYEAKDYDMSEIDRYFDDHETFLREHADEVDLHITEEQFPERLDIALQTVRQWLDTRV